MTTYCAEIVGEPFNGYTKDDILGEAVQTIDAHCPVQKFSAKKIGSGQVSAVVEYWAANDNEAQAIARDAARSMTCQAAAEVFLVGRK